MQKTLVLAALLAACGGGTSAVDKPNTAQVSGLLAGSTFTPKSAIALYSDASARAVVGLYGDSDACDAPFATTDTRIMLTVTDGSQAAGNPQIDGDYTLGVDGGTRYATAQFQTDDSAATQASSGVVDVTHNEDAGLRGTFDVSFADGSKVSGSFDAVHCAALAQTN